MDTARQRTALLAVLMMGILLVIVGISGKAGTLLAVWLTPDRLQTTQ